MMVSILGIYAGAITILLTGIQYLGWAVTGGVLAFVLVVLIMVLYGMNKEHIFENIIHKPKNKVQPIIIPSNQIE